MKQIKFINNRIYQIQFNILNNKLKDLKSIASHFKKIIIKFMVKINKNRFINKIKINLIKIKII